MSNLFPAVYRTELPGLINRGKVREIYDLGDRLMIVASDRISAFDVVMDQPVPGKGAVLTRLTEFWLQTLPACRPHHLEYVVDEQHIPRGYEKHLDLLRGRAMVCRKARVLPIECVVRGYIVGGGWKEYRDSGQVSGITLPAGMQLAQRFPEPLFTPSTKATAGHDEPVSFDRACDIVAKFAAEIDFQPQEASLRRCGPEAIGRALLEDARRRSVDIYLQAARYAEQRGIILADTKFEFGICDGRLILVDEVLTPDSSRFWPADQWRLGNNPPSFDKQFLRDYLNGLEWDKNPPPPAIPENIIAQTRERYLYAYRLLTGLMLG